MYACFRTGIHIDGLGVASLTSESIETPPNQMTEAHRSKLPPFDSGFFGQRDPNNDVQQTRKGGKRHATKVWTKRGDSQSKLNKISVAERLCDGKIPQLMDCDHRRRLRRQRRQCGDRDEDVWFGKICACMAIDAQPVGRNPRRV